MTTPATSDGARDTRSPWATWTVLHSTTPTARSPWEPAEASWWRAGHSSAGRARAPEDDGRWWSVLAAWDELEQAEAGPPAALDVTVWHVVMRPVSAHGDLVLADGATPFRELGGEAPPGGPVALVTVAGSSPDGGRGREFSRRFLHVTRDISTAPGHLVSVVHAPAVDPGRGPVLTFSVWTDLEAGRTWAYTVSRSHTSAVSRQRDHRLVDHSGSLRCTVLSSSGTLGDHDPLEHVLVGGRSGPAGAGR